MSTWLSSIAIQWRTLCAFVAFVFFLIILLRLRTWTCSN